MVLGVKCYELNATVIYSISLQMRHKSNHISLTRSLEKNNSPYNSWETYCCVWEIFKSSGRVWVLFYFFLILYLPDGMLSLTLKQCYTSLCHVITSCNILYPSICNTYLHHRIKHCKQIRIIINHQNTCG